MCGMLCSLLCGCVMLSLLLSIVYECVFIERCINSFLLTKCAVCWSGIRYSVLSLFTALSEGKLKCGVGSMIFVMMVSLSRYRGLIALVG
jgi:hypothetical protein